MIPEAHVMIIGKCYKADAGWEAPVKSAGGGMMRITRFFAIIVVSLLFNTLCFGYAAAEKKIGILLFNEQPRYVENKRGVIDQLRKHGFSEPNYKFTIESADGSKVKALQSVRRFVAANMDMIITIGTSATIIAAAEVSDIPLVFVMVWDPVESKIARSWKSSGNNVTGVSSKTSASRLLGVLREISDVRNVAVLYTRGERNTEIQLKEFQAEQKKYNVRIIPVSVAGKEDLANIMPHLVTQAQAICLTGSSVVGDNLPEIVRVATRAGVITASQSEDLVERGAYVGITVDPYAIGMLAGEKAVKILKGAKPSSIPIETLKKQDVIINMKTARSGGFVIKPAFVKKVTKTVE
jgi:putative tryptophan/tyrosine transport system substrate-binding protein